MANTYPSPPLPVSKETHCIAGILTTVYGLSALQADIHNVACLWLLHPRLQTQECMEPIASSMIHEWNEKLHSRKNKDGATGLIAVSFDQRNHGSREVDKLANEAWNTGNERHVQDMFASYRKPYIYISKSITLILWPVADGTAMDTSHLLTYIPSYIFPTSKHTISNNIVLGVSLGGHAAWHCVMQDPRIITAIIIIGCPDYVRLMTDRACRSKLESWTRSSPPGAEFLGSKDFPNGLIEAVEKYDPAGLLLGEVKSRRDEVYSQDPTEQEKTRLMPLMESSLQGKRILNMAGGADRLVPYKCSEPFLSWLKNATTPNGWFGNGKMVFEDIVFDGVGHEMSSGMVKEVHRFVLETLEQPSMESAGRDSKI